jgi:hypothetical protein
MLNLSLGLNDTAVSLESISGYSAVQAPLVNLQDLLNLLLSPSSRTRSRVMHL